MHKSLIVVNSAKARDLLLKYVSQLEVWSERTIAYGCALCCFRRAGVGSWHLTSLALCILLQKRGHGGIELALLSKTNSDAFLKVKETLKEALTGEITDERLEELASNHCERLLCYQGEFAADDGDDGPLTSNELHSCFGRKGGRKGRVQGHLVLTPEFTGYEACEILARLGWSENQIQTRKGVSLYRAYLKTQPQLPLQFPDTPYYTKFNNMCAEERNKAYRGHAPKNGTVHEPVETLGAVQKLKDLAEKGKPPSVSRYAYVFEEEGSVEEESLSKLEKAVGMGNKRQTSLIYKGIKSPETNERKGWKTWTRETNGYSACEKLRRLNWSADSLHRELQYTRATHIFNKFCEFKNVPIAPTNPSRHPFFKYIKQRFHKDKQFSSDEKKTGNVASNLHVAKTRTKNRSRGSNAADWRES